MKHNGILLFVFIILTELISSCNSNHPLSPQESFKAKLTANTWRVHSVTLDGVDITSDYKGFTLTFDNTNYVTKNGDLSWPSKGVWMFKDNETITKIIRDNQIEIKTDINEDEILSLDFNLSNVYNGGRKTSLGGHYLFLLIQQ